jgi:putative DNA primase/helicase
MAEEVARTSRIIKCDLDSIPVELKELRQWVNWKRKHKRDNRFTKVPCQPDGTLADVSDPSTWHTFQECVAALGAFSGLGIVCANGLGGIDLDHCLDAQGNPSEFARQVVDAMCTYTEITPSWRGLRCLFRGKLPPGHRRKDELGIEMYDDRRYFTVTGHHFPGTPWTIEERSDALASLHRRVFGQARPDGPVAVRPSAPVDLDDHGLIESARRAHNGDVFDRLWRGDMSGYANNHSNADLALCTRFAYWTGGDPARIDRLFRQSGLMRPKWDERHASDGRTYGQITVAKAVESEQAGLFPQLQSYPAHKELASLPLTDAGNGEAFAFLFGESVRYDYRRKRWLWWDAPRWCEDDDGRIQRLALEAARQRQAASAMHVEDKDERRRAVDWAAGSESGYRRNAMLEATRSILPIADAGENWDPDPWLLACKNGVVDLTTGALREGRPDDRLTLTTHLAFNPDAPAERWQAFLREVFPNSAVIDFVWRAVGYSLTGDTSAQVLFICHGRGANGKSVFLSTLRRILGTYAANTPFTTFEHADRNGGIPNDVAALAGKRLVTAGETRESARLNEERIKALTGGDPITARFLHAEFFTFLPRLKLWLAVNHRPRVGDDSYGFWRRIRLVPFTRTFDREGQDPRLGEVLNREAGGILAWAIRGCLEWQQRGLEPPDAIKAATEEYQSENDPLVNFMTECCIVEADARCAAGDLYRAYVAHCDEYGDKRPLSAQAFRRRLADRGFTRDRTGGGGKVAYAGIGLLARPKLV